MNHITTDQILALRNEATIAGDVAQIALCDAALAGDLDALAACVKVIDAAAALDSDED